MTTAKEEVLSLVSSGKITSAEGEALLRAMSPPRRSPLRLLTNPFEHLGGGKALAIGAAGSLAGVALSRLHVSFDGALDVHLGQTMPALSDAILHQLVAWPLVAVVAWLMGLAVTRKGRLIDFLGVVGVARIPLVLAGVVAAAARNQLPMEPAALGSTSLAVSLLMVAVALPAVAWMLVLLFHGFRNAAGVQGLKGGAAFVGVVVVAEIAAKVALSIAG